MAWYAINKWSSNSNCNCCPDEHQASPDEGCCPVSIEALERNILLTLSNGTTITGENILPVIPNAGADIFLSDQFDFNEETKTLNLYLNNDLVNPHLEIIFPESFFNGSNTNTFGNGITLNNGNDTVELGGTLTKSTAIFFNDNDFQLGDGTGSMGIIVDFFSAIIPNGDPSLIRSLVLNSTGFTIGAPIFIGTHAGSENQNLEVTPQGEIIRVVKDTSGLKITPIGPNDGTNIAKDFVAYYTFNASLPVITKNVGEALVNLVGNRAKSVSLELDASTLKTPASTSYKIRIQNLPSTHYPIPDLKLSTFTGTTYQRDYVSYSHKYIVSGSNIELEITVPQMFPSETILRGLKIELM